MPKPEVPYTYDDQSVFTDWRKVTDWRKGMIKKIKRRYRKRVRLLERRYDA